MPNKNSEESRLEHTLMNCYKDEMMDFVRTHPDCFDEAVKLALSDKQPYAWRAAWLLSQFIEENDERIRKYIPVFLGNIKSKKDGHQRELLKILLIMDLDEDQESVIFDLCLTIWEEIFRKPSVRFIALRHCVKIAEKYPELGREILVLTQEHYLETLSPGIKNAVSRLVKQIR